MLGRPLRRRLSECPSCKSRLSHVSRARHLSACLFHVSASGAIIAAATANSRRLSQQNPYKTCVSLAELGRTSRHFVAHFEKIPTKKFPTYGRCANKRGLEARRALGFPARRPTCISAFYIPWHIDMIYEAGVAAVGCHPPWLRACPSNFRGCMIIAFLFCEIN